MLAVENIPKQMPLEVLWPVWWIGAVAFGVSLIVTPIVRFAAYRLRMVDRPDALLKPHDRPVAYLGGIAICIGLLSGLGCYALAMPEASARWEALRQSFSDLDYPGLLRNPLWMLLGIALGSVTITVVGLLDDLFEIRPRKKVYGQVSAATILLLFGVGHRMASILLGPLGFGDMSVWVLLPLSAGMCLVLVVATCNAANLLDGLDGLCGGVTGIITLGFLALAVFLALWGFVGRTDVDYLRVGLCLAMAGAVLGFLPYNIPPASIFMGDAGSMLLGFFVAATMALFSQEGNPRWFMAACAIFALPILDTALAVVRRIRSGKSIFAGDRSHLYDQLVDRGMTVKQVVVLFYCLATVAAVIGVVLAILVRARQALVIYAGFLTIIWAIFHKLGMITPPSETRSPTDGDSER